MDGLERWSDRLNRWVEGSLFLLGATMAAVVALQVFFRYALNHSLFWSEELARYLLVWLTFLGATVAYRRRANPGIDALYLRLPRLPRKAAALVVHLASLVLFGVMVVHGARFAHFVRMQVSPALGLPKWIPHAVVPLSGLILAFHALAFLVRELAERPDDR
ncbi:MAG: TRAP transporter small permease [Deferrisomatales bacterium]